MGNPMAMKRVKKEISDLSKENLGGITLVPNDINIFMWKATIPGPAGSPYEGGVFEVDIRIPENYPFSPPHLHFLTKVYHCNIASTGAICLDILKHAWSPAMSLFKVVLSLSSLLTDPNPADPLVPAIASEYKKNRKVHDQTAREWTKNFATPKNAPLLPATTVPAPPAPSASRTLVTSRRARPPPPDPTPPARVAGTRRSNPFTSSSSSSSSSIPAQAASTSISRQPTRSTTTTTTTTSSRNPITLDDSDQELEQASSDIEVLPTNGGSSNSGSRARHTNANGGGRTSGGGSVAGGSETTEGGERAAKRLRGNGGRSATGTADDVIVIDD